MSKNKAPFDLHSDHIAIVDPGDAGTIVADRNPMYVPLVSAGAETRTLARPTKVGDVATLFFKTDGGDITLTVTGGFNEAGDTTLTFANAGEFAVFISCYDGTNYLWRQVSNSFVGNAGAVTQSAALTAAHATLTQAGTDNGDVAIQAVTNTGPYGFVNADEAEAVIACVINAMVRIAELEAACQAAGIVA